MGHHFDSPESRADSRINITDNYVFHGEAPGSVALIMCVSPLAGLPSPFTGQPQWRTFRPGCAYDFRLDTDADLRVDRIVRFVFAGETAPQNWTLAVLEGGEARDHHGRGREIGRGRVGETVQVAGFGRVWIDEAGDPFWLDAVAAKTFIDTLLAGGAWQSDTFSTGAPTTGATNVLGIVAEMTTRLVTRAGTHPEPARHAERVADALLPDVLPFDPQRPAGFGFAGINGRTLRDDFGAVVYSTVFNHPMRNALAPLPDLRDAWPWLPAARPLPRSPGVAVPPRNAA